MASQYLNGLNGVHSTQSIWQATPEMTQRLLLAALLTIALLSALLLRKLLAKPVWLLDLHCFMPPERLLIANADVFKIMREQKLFSEENITFQEKIVERSGMGEKTYLSDGVLRQKDDQSPTTHDECLAESEMILYDCVANVLEKTGTQASEVDAVMVSCSCFAPTPSMAAMLVNRFRLKEDVLTYNLSGMGCSSSLVCVDLAKHLLKAMPNKLILVVNHENITRCRYAGDERYMLVCNSLFRIGGAAVLMSNRPKDAGKAKYLLQHTVRIHMGANDDAFGCMGQKEDMAGLPGVFLKTNVVKVAGEALARNLRTLGRLALPVSEKVKFVLDRTYIPRFNAAFEHYLMHTGGRGVLDALGKEPLNLTDKQLEASRQTLSKFGNTSAASTWYVLARLEQDGLIKKGDRLWQLGFGGGFKACSAVWKARRFVQQDHTCWGGK